MELSFVKEGSRYISEFKVSSDFNLHIERDKGGYIFLYQRSSEGGEYDSVGDSNFAPQDLIIDYDCSALVYPKTIKIVSEVEPTYASLTTSGEVTEIKSQSKEIEVTSNGTTEVTPDAGFAYLNSVKVKTNVAGSGGGGGTQLEGEYFLAKPNGRYWKFTFMPEGYNLRIEDFEASQIDAMYRVYDLLVQLQCVYGAAVSTDDVSLTDELAKVDGFYNIAIRINGTLKSLKLYRGGYEYIPSEFNEGFLRVWKECDIKSNPPAEIEIEGIVLPPSSNLVELIKVMARFEGMEITDDEAILFLEQQFMLIPATEEEYKYWRFEEEE